MGAILDLVDPKKELWDFCCDHGSIGLEAAARGLAKTIHFIDKVPSIIDSLNEKLKASDIPGVQFNSYCEDATKIQRNFSNSTIILAGIGEKTALNILERWTMDSSSSLILSIHSDNYELRKRLRDMSFGILREEIVQEKGKYYELMKISLGHGEEITEVGASMWSSENPASIEYLEQKINYLKIRLRHQNDEALTRRLRELESIFIKLRCL